MADWSQSGAWMVPGQDGGGERHRAIQQRANARREIRLFMRRLGILMVALTLLVMAGTIAFVVVEGVSPAYGFDWTVDTVTTLGSIPDPHDAGGRVVKVGLELLGIGTLFYGLATVAEFFVSGQLSGMLEERRIEKMIDSFSDHYIVCGFGRVGRQVSRDLRTAGAKHVVIDPNPLNREAALAAGVPLIESEASDDVSPHAGGDRAGAGRDRVRGLRRREHLHRADRARAALGHLHHRSGVGRGLREEAAASRRRPRHLAL